MPQANDKSAGQPTRQLRSSEAAASTDLNKELEEIVRALARAAARKDHSEALEAEAKVPTEADGQ